MIDKELQKYVGTEEITVVEAMQKIDINTEGILFIADGEERLVGSLTDGDIRRWLIRTGKLDVRASQMMCKDPKFLLEDEAYRSFDFMRENQITSVPVLSSDKRIMNIVFDSYKRKVRQRMGDRCRIRRS